MQAENWSPNGEARELIQPPCTRGHTSMSVGDVIGTGADFYEVSRTGFRRIPERR
jgi:hypothetical protein